MTGCILGKGVAFSYTTTIEVGADLGLEFDKIINAAGISGAVSVSRTVETSDSVQKTCPNGPWQCGFQLTPPVTIVSGQRQAFDPDCNPGPEAPYTVSIPEANDHGLITGGAVDVCVCKNFEHWADKGAPEIICLQDCQK